MKEPILNYIMQIFPWLESHGLKIIIILIVAYTLNKVGKQFILRTLVKTVIVDRVNEPFALKKRQDTLMRILSYILVILIIFVASLMILKEIGVPIGPVLTSAGIVGLAVGFGGQYLIRDVIAGFFIILENQYRIGDVVNLDETGGMVEDISLRMTTLRDLDGTVHHVPHGEIKRVSNLSKHFARINLNIGVSYGARLEHAIEVINRVGNELAQDNRFAGDLIKPPQFLRVDDFSDSAIVLKILGETQPLKQWEITGELRKRLKIEFDKEHIEIPYPQRVVHQAK